MSRHPDLGFGIGLRTGHFAEILERGARVDWLEAISENFLVAGGRPLHVLERVRRDHPLVLHGVSLSIGGTDPLDEDYLRALRALADRFEPAWVSDHLCWTGVDAHNLHDLLPLPWTEETLALVASRVERVQDALGRRLVLENVSSYLTFTHSTLSEWEFLGELARRADCDLLLDVNNVWVSAYNHGFDPRRFIDEVPAERVVQIHLAGHSEHGTHLLDTHDAPVADAVWDLYRHAVARLGRVSTLVEWDGAVPPLAAVEEQAQRARAVALEASRGGERAA
ncbi:MAG: DUF692 domain-containing protein [Thermodesulfobacteriota bacterium]